LFGVKFLTMWLNFRSTRKAVPLLVKACVVGLIHLVSGIAAIAILYFLSSLIVIRRPPGMYSDHTFQVANCKFYLRLLLVFIVLICLIFEWEAFLKIFSEKLRRFKDCEVF
jgi:hypothetical protein